RGAGRRAGTRAHEARPAEPAAFKRHDGRDPRQMRGFKVQRGVSSHAEGSALVAMGKTRVLCTASVEERVPGWLRGQGKGWGTAEYGMLPRSTGERPPRSSPTRAREPRGRCGRWRRATTPLPARGGPALPAGCAVRGPAGGPRPAAITGALGALPDACVCLPTQTPLAKPPLQDSVAAISVGLVQG